MNLLRAEIAKKGLTQAKVAENMGITATTLSRKMTGQREFTLKEANQMCKILEIANPIEVFFTNTIPNTQQSDQETPA